MKTLFIALIAFLGIAPAQAHDFTSGSIYLDHPMIQEAPPNAPVLGGYVTVQNTGTEDDRLLGIESPAVAKVELHQSVVTDGIARMQPLDGLLVPAGQIVWLGDNGTHAMFVDPDRRYVEGDEVPATLVFEKAGRIAVTFMVEKTTKAEMAPGHGGNGADDGGQ